MGDRVLRKDNHGSGAGSSNDPLADGSPAWLWASDRVQTVAPLEQGPTTQQCEHPHVQIVGPPRYRDIRYSAETIKGDLSPTSIILELYPEQGRVTSTFCELASKHCDARWHILVAQYSPWEHARSTHGRS